MNVKRSDWNLARYAWIIPAFLLLCTVEPAAAQNRGAGRQARPAQDGEDPADQPGGPHRRGMRGPGPHGQGNPDWERMGEVDRQEVRKFLQQHFPALSLELQDLREKDPELFRRRIRRVIQPILRLMRVMRNDPELGALLVRERQIDLEIRREATDLQGADPKPDRQQVRQTLVDLHTQLFDVQQKRRQLEIIRIEAKLMELQGRLQENAKSKEQLIRQRVDSILENPGEWLTPPPAQAMDDADEPASPNANAPPDRD